MNMINKIKEVESLVASGEKVYKACIKVGIKRKDFYTYRGKEEIKRPMSKSEIKKATKILYMGLTNG